MCFLEEDCGVAGADRWTNTTVYVVAKKEILASALPGGLPRQASRFPATLLGDLEDPPKTRQCVPYFRIFGWCSFWCGGHCGSPIIGESRLHRSRLTSQGFTAKLTHSKNSRFGPKRLDALGQ